MDNPLTFGELASLMNTRAGLTVDAKKMESRPHSTFAEFGLDSLGLLGIVAELENRYGTPIGPDAESCKTPHEFVGLVNAQLASGV